MTSDTRLLIEEFKKKHPVKIWSLLLPEIARGRKDATRIDPDQAGRVQPTIVEVNRCFESFLVPESVSPLLDGLDPGIQSLTHHIGIACTMDVRALSKWGFIR